MTTISIILILLLVVLSILKSTSISSRPEVSWVFGLIFCGLPFAILNFNEAMIMIYGIYIACVINLIFNYKKESIVENIFLPTLLLNFSSPVFFLIPIGYLVITKNIRFLNYLLLGSIFIFSLLRFESSDIFLSVCALALYLSLIFEEKGKFLLLFSLCVLQKAQFLQSDVMLVSFSICILLIGLIKNSVNLYKYLLLTIIFSLSLLDIENRIFWATAFIFCFPPPINLNIKLPEIEIKKFLLFLTFIFSLFVLKNNLDNLKFMIPISIFLIFQIKESVNTVLDKNKGEMVYRLIFLLLGIGISLI